MCGGRGRMTRKSGRRLGRAEGGPGQRRTGGVERRPMEYGEGLCEAVPRAQIWEQEREKEAGPWPVHRRRGGGHASTLFFLSSMTFVGGCQSQ
jgi:hypothetical protein